MARGSRGAEGNWSAPELLLPSYAGRSKKEKKITLTNEVNIKILYQSKKKKKKSELHDT